jgi:cytochrome c nitrite reductase small subunit
MKPRKVAVVFGGMLGVLLGAGLFTFDYGEGLSYFGTDPKNCMNCHIMRNEYDSWQKSGHHQAAVCVDCHLPHEFIPKYLAKADNGYRHSKGFTFNDFHEPIQIKPRNANILQDSCIRCHADFVHELVEGSRSVSGEAVQCVHCHRGVGHGMGGMGVAQ